MTIPQERIETETATKGYFEKISFKPMTDEEYDAFTKFETVPLKVTALEESGVKTHWPARPNRLTRRLSS